MKVYQLGSPQSLRVRAHPWVDAEGDSAFRYHDLRKNPSQVRTHLEDFVPYAQHPAIETFYQLVEEVNGAQSVLESNDCAFNGPERNTSEHSSLALEVSGRLMVLYRDLKRNTVPDEVENLVQAVGYALTMADPELEEAIVGVSLVDVHYTELGQQGHQLMLSFWAWGNTDAEAFAHLGRTLENLASALRTVR